MAEPEHDDEIPIKGWWAGHPMPDLARIPRERWVEVLRQTHPSVREKASQTLGEIALMGEASQIAWRPEVGSRCSSLRLVTSQTPLKPARS